LSQIFIILVLLSEVKGQGHNETKMLQWWRHAFIRSGVKDRLRYILLLLLFCGVTGGRTAPGDTLLGGDSRRKKNLFAYLQRIVEKRGRAGKKGVG